MDTPTANTATMVTALIDVSVPSGRKIIKELENKRSVTLQYENPEMSGTWHDWEDVQERALNKMSEHYGIDMRPLVAKFSKYYK